MLSMYTKGRFFSILESSNVISREVTQDKKAVTDFRHLNMRITKNNLAYPLLKDTFSVLGHSRCKVLSVLDLKDAFHSLRLSENSNRYCGILPYFGSTHTCTKECLWDQISHHQFGNLTLMQFWTVYKAENTARQ